MPHDPLHTLHKLRKTGQDEARQALARALQIEASATATATTAERTIVDEQQTAMDLAAGDHVVEAFAAWLPTARATAAQAWQAAERAQSEVARTRALLTAAQAATETVETLILERATARQAHASRREQANLNEAAGRWPREELD